MKHHRLKAQVIDVLRTLTLREGKIIKLRYGLDDGTVYTRKSVGRKLGINEERAKQIEEKALRKLAHPLRRRRLEEFCHILATDGPSEPEGYAHLMEGLFGTHARHGGPNLFRHASRELSQDAFFCWLLSWAERREKYEDAAKHKTGIFFLNSLLALHQMQPPEEYTRLEIRRQYRGLDILILINHDIALLIEDKTASSEHDDQLRRYLEAVRECYPKRTPVPVYIKIGNQSSLQGVLDAGWQCFLRRDLLCVLAYGHRSGVISDIFDDYHTRLMRLDHRLWKSKARI